jgi:hypothetical protein
MVMRFCFSRLNSEVRSSRPAAAAAAAAGAWVYRNPDCLNMSGAVMQLTTSLNMRQQQQQQEDSAQSVVFAPT